MRSPIKIGQPGTTGMATALPSPRRGGVWLLAVALTVLALALSAPLAGAHDEPGVPAGQPGTIGAAASPPAGRSLAAVGSVSLPGFNADVWNYGGYAYIGTWGTGNNYPRECPARGVRIIDLSDPRNPTLTGAVATIGGTTQEDVEVARVETAAFQGDLLVTGVQACVRGSDAPRGLDLWDVSDPRNPQHLAFWSSGPGNGAAGVHELHLFQRGDRAYVAAAVPFSELLEGQGDFRLVDVTDPRRPAQVSAWGATLDGGLVPGREQTFYDHSAYTNDAGTLAILSYWDAGAIVLDIADPARPRFVGRTTGNNTHSVWLAQGESVLLTADELGQPEGGAWGYLHAWDVRDSAAPREIGSFATPDSRSGRPGRQYAYTVHNPFVRGGVAYLSWFGEGVRVVDLADPAAPREIAAFIPAGAGDPYGVYPAAPEVWGVHADRGVVVVSDINAGLYVLQSVPPETQRCFPETGKCVQGRLLDYWQEHGGLAINGYPISDELVETLEDGRQYTVQYFERSRLENHPENAWPYDVLLGQFGRRIHPDDPAAAPGQGATYFAETGHNLAGRFLGYWRANGGLAEFGYPISEEFVETLEDGREYTVQYFERARFEYHPEVADPRYQVLLGQFGRRIFGERGGTERLVPPAQPAQRVQPAPPSQRGQPARPVGSGRQLM
jgi:hypothetical protein